MGVLMRRRSLEVYTANVVAGMSNDGAQSNAGFFKSFASAVSCFLSVFLVWMMLIPNGLGVFSIGGMSQH